jgi:hypothetical protein
MAHVLPGANLMNPFSPQPVPHEFFTFQFPELSYPTASTACPVLVLTQLENTPEEYLDQLLALTLTATG